MHFDLHFTILGVIAFALAVCVIIFVCLRFFIRLASPNTTKEARIGMSAVLACVLTLGLRAFRNSLFEDWNVPMILSIGAGLGCIFRSQFYLRLKTVQPASTIFLSILISGVIGAMVSYLLVNIIGLVFLLIFWPL